MKAYVAVTDNDWFRFLRDRSPLDEVNFWQPGGGRVFKILTPGQPFLFKLHSPENFIAGGGYFAHASLLDSRMAWDAFGEKNGAGSFDEMRIRIEKYRRAPPNPYQDYIIGCIILQAPFFLEDRDWIPVPRDFHPNIQQGKTYDLTSLTGKALWEAVSLRLHAVRPGRVGQPEPAPYGDPVLVRQRLGQGAFRVLVTDVYQRACAVTREKAVPALEAAHIKPVSEGGFHRIDNGLLFRSDLHRLFDRGYVTVAPDYRFLASRKLKNDFDNGEEYLKLHGTKLWLPSRSEDRPQRQLLEWHADTVFRG